MSAEPRANWTQGQFNAWVEAGEDKNERRARLDRVPEKYRGNAERHLKTVWAMRKFYSKKTLKN